MFPLERCGGAAAWEVLAVPVGVEPDCGCVDAGGVCIGGVVVCRATAKGVHAKPSSSKTSNTLRSPRLPGTKKRGFLTQSSIPKTRLPIAYVRENTSLQMR